MYLRHILLFICTMACASIGLSQDFYNSNAIREIRIEFERDNWEKILDAFKYDGKSKRMTGKLTVDGVVYDSVGVRYKGNSSYFAVRKSGSNKLPFNIKINHKIKGQKIDGKYSKLKLSNGFRDPSFIREVLAYEVAREFMPASKCNFARVFVNDEYLGLYSSVESVDKDFLLQNFDNKDGVFVKCDPVDIGSLAKEEQSNRYCEKGEYSSLMFQGKDSTCYMANYELKSKTGWKEFTQLINILENKPEKIESVLNVDMALWMLAYNNVLVNLDSYQGKLSHNYYMYKEPRGVFNPIVWDLNMAFGGFRYDGNSNSALELEEMQDLSLLLHFKNEKRPLVESLLKFPLYRKMYVAHVKTIVDHYFANDKFKERAKQLQSQIDYHVQNDQNKLYSYEDFKSNLDNSIFLAKSQIVGINELMDSRIEYLKNHPLMLKQGPYLDKPEVELGQDSVMIKVKCENANSIYLFHKSALKPNLRKVRMIKSENTSVGAVEYYIELPKDEIEAYFLVASNDKTATVSPERSAIDFHWLPTKHEN